jgi:ligand-binding SRPBCC domain-containing protein
VPIYEKQSVIDTPAPVLFAWHTRPGAFERLAPPWEHLRIVSRHGGIADGSRLTLELRYGPIKTRWESLHRDFVDGQQFTDVQVAGPFKRWEHTHRIEPVGGAQARLTDHVEYAMPFGPLGAVAGGPIARRMMERLFTFRHRRIATDLSRHLAVGQGRRLRLVLTGRTGWVLTQLAAFLGTGGHVVRLFPTSEDPRTQPSEAAWGPTLVPDFAALEQADAVIHMGLGDLHGLLAALDERGSRARTVIALPTLALPSAAPVTSEALEQAIATSTRRVAVLLTAGVLAAWPALEGSVPRDALSPSVDGALVGVDDLIGATYFALCDDSVRGLFDVTLPRAGASAALPPEVARWLDELRVLRHFSPAASSARHITEVGFAPLNPTLAATVLAEIGWPG